ncbi:AIR synthase related protein [Pelistega europaea]|uniref:Phosphoribosylformylglycinamidine cyclo-ligase n=1 Tax=Pelistega europaea TaxID=106147 RepID=A0A7Y4P6B6_9BURK|nr:AIR synthase related protein [Pelistega europaea]NOL49590.1 phosphoribosylformylglycinamidine cyclo-ligase [Pelistega europaea]
MSDIYKSYGVSSGKEEVHAAIKVMKPTSRSGAFCQAVAMGDDYHIIHADGAGTKAILAYLAYKENGDARVFEDIAVDSIVMNTDDMLCTGITTDFLVSNTIGRNAQRIPQEVLSAIMRGYQQFADNMADFGINIQLCGGETADIGDLVSTIVVDSTAFAKIPQKNFIDASTLRPQKEVVIVGLASFGQSSYEQKTISGIGSNGFTVARHETLCKDYAHRFPETFSSTLNIEQVYNGKYHLFDQVNGQQTVAELLLSPCRTYLPIMKTVYQELGSHILSVIHNTGGGLTKSINFGQNIRYIKDNLFDLPFVFELIQSNQDISFKELWSIFNCGQRLEIYCEATYAQTIIDVAKHFNVAAQIIGRIEPSASSKNEVLIQYKGNEVLYAK